MNFLPLVGIIKSGLFPTPSVYSRVDSITHKTVFIIAVFLILSKVYDMSFPVHCVLPNEQRPETLPWAENYCMTNPHRLFIHNVSVKWNAGHRLEKPLSFYTGTPYIFAAFAFVIYICFKVLIITINSITPIKRVLDDLKEELPNLPYATQKIQPCADLLLSWLQRTDFRVKIIFLYAIFKIMIIISFSAFFLFMQYFIGMDDTFWALKVLSDSWLGSDTIENRFQTDVTCKPDKIVGIEATLESKIMSCNLPLMAVYKYLYVSAWFWVICLVLVNILHFFYLILFFLCQQRRTIGNYCWNGRRRPTSRFLWSMQPFVKELSPNGVFLIELVKGTLGEIAAKSLCVEMLDSYNAELERA